MSLIALFSYFFFLLTAFLKYTLLAVSLQFSSIPFLLSTFLLSRLHFIFLLFPKNFRFYFPALPRSKRSLQHFLPSYFYFLLPDFFLLSFFLLSLFYSFPALSSSLPSHLFQIHFFPSIHIFKYPISIFLFSARSLSVSLLKVF